MSQDDWITIVPSIAGYLIWPAYRLIIGNKKTMTASILKVVFLFDLGLSIFLALDMKDMQKRHVTDAADTIFLIIFVALLSFAVSTLTIFSGVLAGLLKKYLKHKLATYENSRNPR